MARNPQDNAETRGLSRNVLEDVEADEGPASQGHHGETRTRIPEHADRQGHGPKTQAAIKQQITRQKSGGTH